ncbi:unnamed protein product [Heterobilharzia americana]|nr:unnamed protein product [Heterobilharzia americana]
MSGHLYTGYLAVVTNQEHRNQESDLLFQFTCKTNNDVPHRVPGQVFQRSIETEKSDFFKDPPWPKLDVKLSIKDENGQSVQTILESTSVRFEAELVDELNIYKAVIVEECYMIDKIESGQRNEGSKETLLLYKGCPMLKAELKEKSSVGFNFHKNHYDNEQALIFRSTDNLHYLQTGLFRLYPNYSPMSVDGQTKTNTQNASSTFTHDRTAKLTFEKINSVDETYKRKLNEIGHRLHELKFTCTFRVCKQLAWCSWPSVCDSTMSSLNNPRITFLPPSLRIIQRSVPLYLIESVPSSHLPVKKQATSKVCGELFCSNTLHIVLMMGLVGVLTCLMGVMGMLLARKYRQRLNQTRTSVIRNKSKMKHSKHYHCSQHSEINSHLTKSYDNPISQSVTSQHLLHQQYQKPHQQSENDTLKSLLKADNGIHTNDNSNTIHQAYAVDIKDCCKYWLNEHSYANPLLLQKSPNDLSQCHQHHYTHLCQQQHQQQMSSSSTVATPTHCSCLSEIIFNDSKNIQNSHNYYTFKHYTTLPTTTFTPLNSTSFLKDEEFPIMNRTTTFILEPTNTSISTNSVTNNNNNNGNIHEFITTTYPTTLINNHNHSILYCSEHLNDCHDSTVPQYHHSYAQKQRHCEQEQYREFGDSNNDNDSNLKNKHSVNNQSEISLKEYNKLANLTDTVYFGVDYHNSNYATNPLDLTVCTKGVQQEQTPSHKDEKYKNDNLTEDA